MSAHFADWHEYEDDGRFGGGRFANLRHVLSTDYNELADDEVEQVLDSVWGEGAAEDLESFWGQVQKIGSTAGGYLKNAAPGMIQGATTGAALGPWGIVGGALAGGAASIAQQATAPKGARGPIPAGGLPAGIPGGQAAGHATQLPPVPPPNGSPAAGQLLQLLARPEIVQALMSMAMGSAGRPSVRVGDTPVPVGGITNLLGVLANQASAEYHAVTVGESTGTPAYLLDRTGEFVCDPTNAAERAGVVLDLLADSNPWDDSADESASESCAVDRYGDYASAFYDDIELAELYAGGELEY